MTSEGRWGKLKYTKEHTVCNTQTRSNGLKADRLHCNGSWKKSREKTRSVCLFLKSGSAFTCTAAVIKRSCSELQLSPEGVSLGIMAVVVGVADLVRSHVQLGEAE